MNKQKEQGEAQKGSDNIKLRRKDETISYRLKCVKTANGLSHFSMYGDVPKEKTML